MATATVTYLVAVNQLSQIKSCVLEINYIDAAGVRQRIPEYSTATGGWSYSFTGTIGQTYSISAIEIQGGLYKNSVGQGVQVTVIDSNGPTTTVANNYTNTSLRASLNGTI
jgi:hypothetical protein